MLRLEEFMEIQKLYHDGVSVSETARRLAADRAPMTYEVAHLLIGRLAIELCHIILGSIDAISNARR